MADSGWLRRVERVLTALDTAMGLAGGGLFFIVAWYIVSDVIGRNYTGFYSGGTDELSGYALAIGTAWAMAFTLRRKGHVAIDVVTAHLSAQTRAVLDLVALLVMLLFAGLLAWFAWDLALGSWAHSEHSVGIVATPLALPQFLMAVGFTVFTLEALVLFAVGCVRLTPGATLPPADVAQSAGDSL